jgi:hypothetical protein
MKRSLILLSVLVVSLLLYVQLVSAQSVDMQSCTITNPCPTPTAIPANPDRDNDGQNDDVDHCPGEAGPESNRGCPVANDNDGDGTLNDQDRCPNEPGPAQNGGCPAGLDADGDGVADAQDQCPAQAGPAANNGCLPVIPDTGICRIATAGNQVVNVRSTPSTDASIAGTLSPAQTYAVLEETIAGGVVWYRVSTGWVSGEAVRHAGDCPDPQASAILTPLLKGIFRRTSTVNVRCEGNNAVISWANFNEPMSISYSRTGAAGTSTYTSDLRGGIYTLESPAATTWTMNITSAGSRTLACPDSEPLNVSVGTLVCIGPLIFSVGMLPGGSFMLWLRRRLKQRKAAKNAVQDKAM